MQFLKIKSTRIRFFRSILAGCMLISLSFHSGVMAADEGTTTATQQTSEQTEGKNHVILNMVDTDISVLIETISAMTGKTFIIDSNVRGKVNVVSREKITIEEAYRLFESVMEVNGFSLVPSGKAIKVVPASEARSKNIETRVESPQASMPKDPDDKLITQLIPLKYADANNVKIVLTPLVSKTSNVISYSDTNTLIVTDVESNIKRLLHIIEVIDVPGIGREVRFVSLTYADAETVTKILSSVFKTSMSAEKDVAQKTLQFVSDERTNSVIFVASEDDTIRIEKLITYLDSETPKGKGKAHVYSLRHADAEDMAAILQEIPEESPNASGAAKEAAVVSGDITITADKATNSLIIFADSADYDVILDIIEKLDIPRSMVYIEALIMEVTVDKTFELGVEWQNFEDTTIDGEATVVGGGFSSSNGFDPTDLLSANGISMGVVSGAVELTTSAGTYTIPSLGALIKALQTNEDVHILQRPNITVMDNEEANIVVGKKIPYQTRTSTTDNETYNSYDYQTVGLTLKITPHISEDRNIRLEIFQELSALTGASTEISTTPTTLNRSVETTVSVADQSMLVIGGLIDDTYTNKVTKVPLLGSIPILGRLFRYDSKIGNKTNLYVFITPTVVQYPEEASQLTSEVQESMTPEEVGIIKMYGPDRGKSSIRIPAESEPAE